MPIEDALAELVVGTDAGQLGQDAVDAVVKQAVDCVGVALAGAAHPAGGMIHDLVNEFGGEPQARLLGGRGHASVADAAWANGSVAHLLDFDDTGFSHPTACILPAALAVGEWTGASGRDVVAAMAIGYEVFERLAVGCRTNEPLLRFRGLHPTAVWGGPAAAAATCRLLGLGRDQTSIALGLAAGSASGLAQQFGTWAKGLTAGNAARAGVVAGMLARRGYRGDDHALSGRYGLFNALVGQDVYDPRPGMDGWDRNWAIVDPGLSIKPYPACTSTLRAVDAMLEITEMDGYDPQAVARIVIDVHPDLLHTLRYHAPEEGFRGKFSLDYTVASAALDGALTLWSFCDAAARRPALRELLGRIELRHHPDWDLSRRHDNPITVMFTDGHSVERCVTGFRGSSAHPLTHTEIMEKFLTCATEVLPAEHAKCAADTLFALDGVSHVSEVLDHLASSNEREERDA